MKLKMFNTITAIFMLGLSNFAHATLIEFVYTGTGSGSIGGINFSNTAFTITEYSDTNDLLSCGGPCVFIDAQQTTITLENIGEFNFITGTRTFKNNGLLGLSRASESGLDLYSGFNVGDFDMASALAPVAATPGLFQWDNSPVNTSGGVLSFADSSNPGTFEARFASAIPEPSTMAVFGLGLLGLSLRRNRK
ncbi:PEP-CTERM sorting domain-containing protein [Thalassotalea ganghwensis]